MNVPGLLLKWVKNLTDKYKKGQRFVLQPAMGLPSGYSAGYSYEYFGGNATYMIIPEIVINLGCVLPYHGSYFCCGVTGRAYVLHYWRLSCQLSHHAICL